MSTVAIESSGGLLRITFEGHVTEAVAQSCAQDIERLLAGAKPGFTLLTDLSRLERMDLTCEPVIGRMMEVLNQHGIQKVVRVIPDPWKDIGFGIMSLFHYGHGVRVITCNTLAEAQKHVG
jgi:hypothetical protein